MKKNLIFLMIGLLALSLTSQAQSTLRPATLPEGVELALQEQLPGIDPVVIQEEQPGDAGRDIVYVLDQNQPNGFVYMAQFGQTDLAQSFITQQDYVCGAGIGVFSPGGNQLTANITIGLWNNLPNAGGTLLATGTQTNVVVDGNWIWADVYWPAVQVTPGTTYYLVFTSSDPNAGTRGDVYNPYPHGMVYANPGYYPFPNFDYTFRTYTCDGQVVPVSDWALYLGIFLILSFIVLRLRKSI